MTIYKILLNNFIEASVSITNRSEPGYDYQLQQR